MKEGDKVKKGTTLVTYTNEQLSLEKEQNQLTAESNQLQIEQTQEKIKALDNKEKDLAKQVGKKKQKNKLSLNGQSFKCRKNS